MADCKILGNWKLLTSENFDGYMKVSIKIIVIRKNFFRPSKQ